MVQLERTGKIAWQYRRTRIEIIWFYAYTDFFFRCVRNLCAYFMVNVRYWNAFFSLQILYLAYLICYFDCLDWLTTVNWLFDLIVYEYKKNTFFFYCVLSTNVYLGKDGQQDFYYQYLSEYIQLKTRLLSCNSKFAYIEQ